MERLRDRRVWEKRLGNLGADLLLKKEKRVSRKRATDQLHESRARLRALHTVLPRSSSPDSPLYFPSDPELTSLLPELESIASHSVLSFFDRPLPSTPQSTSRPLHRGNSLLSPDFSTRTSHPTTESTSDPYMLSRNRHLPEVLNPRKRLNRCESAGPKVLYYFAKREEVHPAYLEHIGRMS